MNVNIASPLEQFEVVSLFSINAPLLGYTVLSVTNLGLYTFIAVFVILGYHFRADQRGQIIPSRWSISIEAGYASLHGLVKAQIGQNNELYFPFIYSLFYFILASNLIGNIPYSFTIGTSAILSLGLSITIFIGVTILGLTIHRIHFFAFFVPAGTPLPLVPLLVPIELISYLARAFSLGIRLFANLSRGHILMKILSGFLRTLFTNSLLVSIVTLIPFVIFLGITGLEIAVSFIQRYVFCVLTSSYIKDAISLHLSLSIRYK